MFYFSLICLLFSGCSDSEPNKSNDPATKSSAKDPSTESAETTNEALGNAGPSFYGLEFGMSQAQALKVLKGFKGLGEPTINEEKLNGDKSATIISSKSTADAKFKGLRSVELFMFGDHLVGMDIFVFEDGGQEFADNIKSLEKYMGQGLKGKELSYANGILVKSLVSNNIKFQHLGFMEKSGLISSKDRKKMEDQISQQAK